MKSWSLAIAIGGLTLAGFQTQKADSEYVIFLSGNAQGYLAPCGCSAPMMGGVQRRATAIKTLGAKGRTLLLENGGQVKSASRQDEIKLETFAQMHRAAHGEGLNISSAEAALGPGAVISMARLSDGRVLMGSVANSGSLGAVAHREAGPFVIGGLSMHADQIAASLGKAPTSLADSARNLVQHATRVRRSLLILLDGDHDDAVALAREFPTIAMIQYRSAGRPPAKSERVGNVLILSPGDGGRFLVRLVWKTDRFTSYTSIELDPGFKDDPEAKRLYKTYLNRISAEKLLEALPRTETGKFSGSSKCGSCHAEADKVWRHSKHAKGLKTLELVGHDRDPDCVECHVVGLASIYGFKSRKETPDLAHVGCENCHGPGEAHSLHPKEVKMGPAGERSCLPCHTVDNSPKFDFATYWAKVKHE